MDQSVFIDDMPRQLAAAGFFYEMRWLLGSQIGLACCADGRGYSFYPGNSWQSKARVP